MIKTVHVKLDNLPAITNPVYVPLLQNKSPYLVLCGGAGSGKSVFAATKLVARCMLAAGHHFGVFRKVANTLDKSVCAEIRRAIDRLGAKSQWRENQNRNTFTFTPNGSRISYAGLDDAEKIKSIVGISGAWIEEATEVTEDDLDQIDLRIRGETPGYKQIVMSFNPISIRSFLYRRFYERTDPDASVVNTTYRDNLWLDIAAYEHKLFKLRERSPGKWQIYGEGKWGRLEGLIYTHFDRVPWPDRTMVQALIYGQDYGFTAPSALIECKIIERDIWVRELIYETELTNTQLLDRWDALKVSRVAPIYCDPAEPARIEEARIRGYNALPADKGPGSVGAGISLVQALKIHSSEWNVNLNSEADSYQWKVDRAGKPLDVPFDDNDHGMDALRYALFSHLRGRADYEGIEVQDLVKAYGSPIPDLL